MSLWTCLTGGGDERNYGHPMGGESNQDVDDRQGDKSHSLISLNLWTPLLP